MYAVIEVGGMQWKVEQSNTIRVPKMDNQEGKSIELDRVLLYVNQDDVQVGQPLVTGAKVKATVLSHGKGKKIKVFKKKRRKGYQVLKGHRQNYTELRIDKIELGKGTSKPAAEKKADTKIEKSVKADPKQKSAKPAAKPKVTKAAATKKVKDDKPKAAAAPKKPAVKKTQPKKKPKTEEKTSPAETEEK